MLALMVAGTARAENWDRFRGPNGAGQSDAAAIPSEWKEANFLWKQPLPGVGHSSPVIWDDRVFVTSADTANRRANRVRPSTRTSGAPLWERRFPGVDLFDARPQQLRVEHAGRRCRALYIVMWLDGDQAHAAGAHARRRRSVAARRRRVRGKTWLRQVAGRGRRSGLRRQRQRGRRARSSHSIASAATCGGEFRARPATTSFATPCVFDPTADEKLLLAASTASGLTAIDAATGEVAWQGFEDDLPQRCVASPIVAGGMVFVSCGQGGNGIAHDRRAAGDRHRRRRKKCIGLRQSVPKCRRPSWPATCCSCGTIAASCRATTWPPASNTGGERVGGDFHSSPIRIGDRIFGVVADGEVVVLAADRKFKLLARNSLGEPCHATPAVANDRLYVRTESSLLCIGDR